MIRVEQSDKVCVCVRTLTFELEDTDLAKLVHNDTIQLKLEGQGHRSKVNVTREKVFLKWSVRPRVSTFLDVWGRRGGSDPEGLVRGDESGVRGFTPPSGGMVWEADLLEREHRPPKMNFSLEMACFGEF